MAPQARTWGKAARPPRLWPPEGRAVASGASEGAQRERGGCWEAACWVHRPAQSSCHLGGCGRMETLLAGAAGTSAPRQDSVAAGTRGQVRGGQGIVGAPLPQHLTDKPLSLPGTCRTFRSYYCPLALRSPAPENSAPTTQPAPVLAQSSWRYGDDG